MMFNKLTSNYNNFINEIAKNCKLQPYTKAIIKKTTGRRQFVYLPAVAMPLALCVMLEDFTIEEMAAKEGNPALHLTNLTTSSQWN